MSDTALIPEIITASSHRLPDLRLLAQDFYERHYGDGDCWRLIYELLQAGGFLHVQANVMDAVRSVTEIWFQGDPRDPLSLVQPWDWFLVRHDLPAVQNPCLVVDSLDMIHVHRTAGVRIEPMRRWRHRLVQVARLRCLL